MVNRAGGPPQETAADPCEPSVAETRFAVSFVPCRAVRKLGRNAAAGDADFAGAASGRVRSRGTAGRIVVALGDRRPTIGAARASAFTR